MFIRSLQVWRVYAGRGGEGWGVKNKKEPISVLYTFNIVKLVCH